jgi:hypothetical protein
MLITFHYLAITGDTSNDKVLNIMCHAFMMIFTYILW